ncbi:gliding motility protein [Steroidobacter agaridevorans]|uniref:gliding motility protein n=1 Tax=Steroidobacter agaridevorans TaxID=2695856 RepID=UPI001329D5A9|nr:gliding motility protein [Steroidobacter agaridevorans]GFE91643.1 hypothetical protein GCM10011488_65970 [Steroidobacter agaridevorans]
MADWLKAAETKQLRESIDWHLANVANDRALRDRLEGMAATRRFQALAWYWAPRLYKRSRAVFLPFIQQHFAEHFSDPDNNRWDAIAWSGDVAASLDPWLVELEERGEVRLFRRLYEWKHRKSVGWGLNAEVWRKDLLQRFKDASVARRSQVLQMFESHAELDEPAALELYRIDAELAEPFILKHLPRRWFGDEAKRRLWSGLADLATQRGRNDFYFKLYRQQIALDTWQRDTMELCANIPDPNALVAALEQRHPEGAWQGLGKQFHKLLELRGRDAVPYVRKHLRHIFSWRGNDGYAEIVALAKKQQWQDVWAAVIVTCGNPNQYNEAVREVLKDNSVSDAERVRRLSMLSGVSSEWNGLGWGLARVQQLDEANALEIYQRYPAMLRQTFKSHVTPAWSDDYYRLFERAWDRGDEELADYLASRYVTRSYFSKKTKSNINEQVAEKFVALKLGDEDFARRAANVLTLVPAYSIFDYNRLVRENRLARLLFERSVKSFLGSPAAVRDLVEGGEVHDQQLAYRVLASKDERAQELARDNLDILIGTLLRPLHRRTRFAAFGALVNAATNLECARRVLEKARSAFALPDRRYPKEQLVGLIAKILARYPELGGPREQRVIYRRAG